jgi:glutamyl-tRNA synthetase
MTEKVRVRFAPSPTGGLHIGGLRTALFNYLFAKKHGGDFILRIEDTDQTRFVDGAEEYIEEALNWAGIPYDEGPNKAGKFGPYRQSERKDSYAAYVNTLVEKGAAYYAFDTPESLDFHRTDHESKGKTFIYNAHNRLKLDNSLSLSKEETASKIAAGTPYVVRFKTPENTSITTSDIIRGSVSFKTDTLDDKVLFKSDGMPTYHLANVVDDHLMQISHVIRGEEWLPSLALHIQLYQAFGWEAPKFAHLPLIMKPTGKGKLSKRDGEKGGFPVFPLAWLNSEGYKEAGYFPEAVINFLALLGWNPGTEQELFGLDELVATFELERVQKSGARFDPEKTKWFNQQYLQMASAAKILPEFKKDTLAAFGVAAVEDKSDRVLETIIDLVKERAAFTHELIELSAYFFVDPTSYDQKALKKQWKENTPQIVAALTEIIKGQTDFSSAALELTIKNYIAEQSLSFGAVMPPLRLALVGALSGPHVFDIMEVLGKDRCIERILALENAANDL